MHTAVDALSALRAAIMSSGKVDIEGTTGDPDQVIVIDGVRYAASTPTAFIKRSGSTQTHYSLLAVWLQWTSEERSNGGRARRAPRTYIIHLYCL